MQLGHILEVDELMPKTKTGKKKYDETAKRTVKGALHKYKRGKLKSGRSRTTVRDRRQAIAIGLSEARRKGAKVPARSRA